MPLKEPPYINNLQRLQILLINDKDYQASAKVRDRINYLWLLAPSIGISRQTAIAPRIPIPIINPSESQIRKDVMLSVPVAKILPYPSGERLRERPGDPGR